MRPLLLALLCASPALAANPDEPHPHQGVLTPYSGAPPAPAPVAFSTFDLRVGNGAEATVGRSVSLATRVGCSFPVAAAIYFACRTYKQITGL